MVQIPADSAVVGLAEQYADLARALQSDEKPLLVLPNGEFFPDTFRADEASVATLVARMQGYAGLEDVEIDARVIGELEPLKSGGGCGSGACHVPTVDGEALPRVVRTAAGYTLQVPAAELRHSIVLTSRLATALGAIGLFERHAQGQELAQDPALAELAAVEQGFGVLLLEASYLYSKSCGGPSVQRATALGVGELAVAFAFFLTRHEHAPRKAFAELGTTQKALLKEALALLDESPGLARALTSDLDRVARGHFKLREGRSFFARLFGRSNSKKTPAENREAEALAALERGASVEELAALLGESGEPRRAHGSRARDDDELASAVDEALFEMRREEARERA